MLAEKALRQFPILGEHPLLLKQGVYPGDPIRHSLVLDAVASLAVVFHHLSGSTSALLVNLIEDRIAGAGDTDGILLDKPHNGVRVKEVAQEEEEVGEGIGSHRFQDYFHRYSSDSSRWFRLRFRARNNPFLGPFTAALVL